MSAGEVKGKVMNYIMKNRKVIFIGALAVISLFILTILISHKEKGSSSGTTAEQNGVSESYVSAPFQMNTDDIIDEFHEKGYEDVCLVSHILHAPDNGTIGDSGTVDEVYLEASYSDADGYFSITDSYAVLYTYWNKSIGWKNNFEQLNGEPVYNFSGFNDTCWKVVSEEDKFYFARMVAQDITMDSQIEVYLSFCNFDTLKWLRDHEFTTDTKLGTLLAVVDGQVYKGDFISDYLSYGQTIDLFIDDYTGMWALTAQIGIGYYAEEIYWSNDSTSGIQRIDKADFERMAEAAVQYENDAVIDKYGTYESDDGEDAVLFAEVGVYTSDDSEYIQMEALSYGDRYLAEFEGTLLWVEGDTYKAYDDYGTVFTIIFDEEGMMVVVENAEVDELYYLEGFYLKTQEVDYEEAG